MIAICKFNNGKALPAGERYFGETDQTNFSPLKIADRYVVFGMIFVMNRIDFLVCPSEQNPLWAPSSLFTLVETHIPKNWEICMTQSSTEYRVLFDTFKIHSIIGYSSLVNKYTHYVGLLERTPHELQKFFEEIRYSY